MIPPLAKQVTNNQSCNNTNWRNKNDSCDLHPDQVILKSAQQWQELKTAYFVVTLNH